MNRRIPSIISLLVAVVSVQGLQAAPTTAPADPRFGNLPNTNTVFKPAEYKTLEAWNTHRDWLREQVRVAAGLIPEPERTPLNAEITDKREYDGVTIEKVCLESRPGLYVFGNLYRPLNISGKIPAVACALGHWENGRIHQDDSGNYPALGRTLAKLGVTVFIYDMTGVNDGKRQFGGHGSGVNKPDRDLWGLTSFGLQTWTSIRVIDFLQALPEVDPERIGMTGASGGGTQTFILTAIDERVKVAVPVNMISCSMQGGCSCENAPCLRIDTNNMEIGALAAPRPMLMISTSGDWTAKTQTVEYPFVKSIYTLYGAADKLANAHLNYPHNYNKDSREAMYRFMAKWLLKRDDAESIKETDLPKMKAEELMVWTDETAPKDLVKFNALAPQIEARLQKQLDALAPTDAKNLQSLTGLVRTGLSHILGSRFPAPGETNCGQLGKNDSVKTLYTRNDRHVVGQGNSISVTPTGRILSFAPATNGSQPTAASQIPNGWQMVSLTTFPPFGQTGPTSTGKPRGSSDYFTTFNRTDAAESAYDVLTALGAELQHPWAEKVTLAGWSDMGPVCLVARAMVPAELAKERGLRTAIDMNGFDVTSDEAYVKQLYLPHIRQVGGLNALAVVACNGPIWFHNVGPHFNEEWAKAAAKLNGVEVRITREKASEADVLEWLAK
jgi:hypothetical protein